MKSVVIDVIEHDGLCRENEPLTIGVPFAKGSVFDENSFVLIDDWKNSIPMASTPLARWEDGSVKWLLLNFNVDSGVRENRKYHMVQTSGSHKHVNHKEPLTVYEDAKSISIKSGLFSYIISKCGLFSFQGKRNDSVMSSGHPMVTHITTDDGVIWTSRVDTVEIERNNPLSCVLFCKGCFTIEGNIHDLQFDCRFHFYPGSGTVRMDFGIWNPGASKHPGGAWDLGDAGSQYIKKLELKFHFENETVERRYALLPDGPEHIFDEQLNIYQDSSGGKNWKSRNHLNRHGDIPLRFSGYEVVADGSTSERGDRCTPSVSVTDGDTVKSFSMIHFWQNFPKSMTFKDNVMSIELFPEQFGDIHEIQAGERKTHTVYFNISDVNDGNGIKIPSWSHSPLEVRLSQEQYCFAGFSPCVVPFDFVMSDPLYQTYQDYITRAVKGDRTFISRREIIDEYGWRHFGDLYADHEAVFHKGDREFISHYNNQYDGIKGALLQYMRTGDYAWSKLAREMAWHVAEIDIYRTVKDRYQYNSGLFWHTDHHLDAETATHRTVSIKHKELKPPGFFGGGPAYDHNYSSGFCYYYWMTGEPLFKDAALHMIRFAERGIQGPDTIAEYGYELVKKTMRRIKGADRLTPYGFNGPGRGSGNALNSMIDGYLLTAEKVYLGRAAELIRSCISPHDDIASRDLLNPEVRWMYTVFLQALGRFMDTTAKLDGFSDAFSYAKSSFMSYARWMLENERPYLDHKEILEFPNETWAAQEIRKADILALASCYGKDDERQLFTEKSRYFFQISIEHIKMFGDSAYLTRPLVIMMTNGFYHMQTLVNDAQKKSYNVSSTDLTYTRSNSFLTFLLERISKVIEILRKTSLSKEISWIKSRL